jgi:Ca-activated chloride channel family protein
MESLNVCIDGVKKCLISSLALAGLLSGCTNLPAKEVPVSVKTAEARPVVFTSTTGNEFNIKAELDHTKILNSGRQSLYLLVQFDVPEKSAVTSTRPRLNCGVVIDRSGSMAEKNKIEFARVSAAQLVDSLTIQDNIAIVEYDDQIHTIVSLSPVTDKSAIKRLIYSLTPRGSTNLCGGMLQGVDEVKKGSQHGFISRVILLTDGLANQGIVDPQQIATLVRNARKEGISVSAMGLGLDYDENLLQMIAENGGGNYYYIESATQMAHIFEQELNTLTEAVADNIKCTFTGNEIDSVIVYGYEVSGNEKVVEVPLSALHSGEKRSLLMKVFITPEKKPVLDVGTIEVVYTGSKMEKSSKVTIPVTAEYTNDSAVAERSRNEKTYAEALLIEADQSHEKIVALYESGRKDEAKVDIEEMGRTLANANQYLKDTKIAKKLEALNMESNDMDVADRDINAKKSYLKSNKQRLLYAKKGIRAKYILQSGDNGGDVENLQRKLQAQNLYSGPIDGKYSGRVESAVKKYQEANGIDSDGVAGPSTLRSMSLY